MGITDVHSHLYHPDWYPLRFQKQLAIDYLRRRGKPAAEESVGRELNALNRVLSDGDGSICLRVMDKVGIEKRALLVVDWGLELGEPVSSVREINEAILGICYRHPDRLIGFAGVDPRRPDAVSLATWAFDKLGAGGLKLHPTSQGWTLEDDSVAALIDLAAQRKLPVMVHCGGTVSVLSDEHCQPSALLRLSARFAGVNFIAAHSGFSNWRAFGSDPPPNLWFDLSAWQEGLRTEGEELKAEIQQLLGRFPKRVFFGTDSPFYGFNMAFSEMKWIAVVRECAERLGPETVRSVFSGTVLAPVRATQTDQGPLGPQDAVRMKSETKIES
jgi:predicted TIM-barrel fold metal-dependent hydrolase